MLQSSQIESSSRSTSTRRHLASDSLRDPSARSWAGEPPAARGFIPEVHPSNLWILTIWSSRIGRGRAEPQSALCSRGRGPGPGQWLPGRRRRTYEALGKGQMGSALMGPLQISCFLMAYLFPQSVKMHYFCSGPIRADPICPQPRLSAEALEAAVARAAGLREQE